MSGNGVSAATISRDTLTYEQNGWNDRLTYFNTDQITYDANGNPLQYRDGMQFTWVNGRRLNTVTYNNNNNTLSFDYDNNGLRTRKGNTRYYYDSGKNLVGMTKNGYTLLFYYDEGGSPIAFSSNGFMYYYIKNLQGDIMKIVNSSGSIIATYAYDVSGLVLSEIYDETYTYINGVKLNTLRYRGYVYDDETGLYYLQSRYYDPVTTRFINADMYCDTNSGSPLSTNMYAYCENNAVFKFDSTGEAAWWIQSSKSAYSFGHTSLLIQEKPSYWWYFYWSGETVQLFFLGTTSFSEIDEKVRRTITVFNRLYHLKIHYEEHYNKYIHFSGDFLESLRYTERLMNTSAIRNDTIVYSIQFNPSISESEYSKLITSNDINHVLYSRTHLRYKNSFRPESLIVKRNTRDYNLIYNNCMHQCVKALIYGKFNKYNYYAKRTINLFLTVPSPNIAYMEMAKYVEFANSGNPNGGYNFVKYSLRAVDAFCFYSVASSVNNIYLLSKLFGIPLPF